MICFAWISEGGTFPPHKNVCSCEVSAGRGRQLPTDLLRPYLDEEMRSWRVSDDVGTARNNWGGLDRADSGRQAETQENGDMRQTEEGAANAIVRWI